MKRILIASAMLMGLAGFGGGAYLLTDAAIADADAQVASEIDAGGPPSDNTTVHRYDDQTPDATIGEHSNVKDPVADPGGAVRDVRDAYGKGGLTFLVLAVLMIASQVYVRMTPTDADHDGKPDTDGWRGKTWAISGAVVMLGFPILDKLTGVIGMSWQGVLVGAAGAMALLMSSLNPKKGSKT